MANCWAPVRVHMVPEIFCLIFTIRTSRSAALLSKGTAKSVAGSVDFGREAVPFVMHALGERMEAGRAVALAESRAALTG